ncbi:MAG: FAD-dependent monooxygenase [Alphaproteobacteria bacterium]|nr:FAD-dependent monooxygenase [Alphaproteobacteria bacterium]
MKPAAEIAGAGIAGLTAGLALAQKGWRVRVHEQDSRLRSAAESVHLWENGLRVLDALGVLAPAIADAIPVIRHERRNPDGRTFSSSHFGPQFRLYAPLHADLLRVLHDALIDTGGQVVFDSRVIAAAPEGWLYLADGSSLRADLIVGADGTGSAIRDGLGLLKRRRATNQFGYQTVISRNPGLCEADEDCTHCEYWSGARRVLYAPATATLASVQLTSLAADNSGNAVPIDRQSWRELFPNLSWIIDRIPDDCHGAWFEIVRPEYWSIGRVAIIGDAATAQPPFLGHGAGCSMMAAFALVQTIDRTDDLIEGLAEWELRERPFTDWVQWIACRYARLAFLPAEARTVVLKGIDASRWAQRRILFAAASRDVTAMRRYSPAYPRNGSIIYPLIH